MDAIRKKMQSLKSETDQLLTTIARYEADTKDANSKNDQHEADIRDLGKKIQGYECDFDETNDKLTKALAALDLSLSLRRGSSLSLVVCLPSGDRRDADAQQAHRALWRRG